VSANAARQDSDWNFLIIADHPLDQDIITKLKDGLYGIELENDEVVSSIIRSRQEWSSPAYDALLFRKAVERGGSFMNYRFNLTLTVRSNICKSSRLKSCPGSCPYAPVV